MSIAASHPAAVGQVLDQIRAGPDWQNFTGNLTVEGDVSRVKLRVAGNVVFAGDCSEAEIVAAQGSAFFLYGASTNMLVHAGRNIYVRHATLTTLAAKHDIVIEQSVMRSILTAGDKVVSESAAGRIIGGECHAGRQIRVNSAGNDAGLPTILTIGSAAGALVVQQLYPNVTVTIDGVQLRLRQPVRGAGPLLIRLQDRQLTVTDMVPAADGPDALRPVAGTCRRLQ